MISTTAEATAATAKIATNLAMTAEANLNLDTAVILAIPRLTK